MSPPSPTAARPRPSPRGQQPPVGHKREATDAIGMPLQERWCPRRPPRAGQSRKSIPDPHGGHPPTARPGRFRPDPGARSAPDRPTVGSDSTLIEADPGPRIRMPSPSLRSRAYPGRTGRTVDGESASAPYPPPGPETPPRTEFPPGGVVQWSSGPANPIYSGILIAIDRGRPYPHEDRDCCNSGDRTLRGRTRR
jgi:hypothetical protein